jgi:hypothetical protein
MTDSQVVRSNVEVRNVERQIVDKNIKLPAFFVEKKFDSSLKSPVAIADFDSKVESCLSLMGEVGRFYRESCQDMCSYLFSLLMRDFKMNNSYFQKLCFALSEL